METHKACAERSETVGPALGDCLALGTLRLGTLPGLYTFWIRKTTVTVALYSSTVQVTE